MVCLERVAPKRFKETPSTIAASTAFSLKPKPCSVPRNFKSKDSARLRLMIDEAPVSKINESGSELLTLT